MAVKFKITKAAFDKLSDDMKKEYTQDDDEKGYTLDVSGLPDPEDTGALKRANERLKADLEEATTERDAIQVKLDEADKNKGKPERDVERLTTRYEKKLLDAKTEADAKISGLKDKISTSLKSAEAGRIAAKISTVPKLMQEHVMSRLTVEFDADDVPTLKVLKDGKASDLTGDKLGEELVANKDFAGIIIGSKAKGGGAANTSVPPAGSTHSEAPTDLSKASRGDLVEHMKQVVAQKTADGTLPVA